MAAKNTAAKSGSVLGTLTGGTKKTDTAKKTASAKTATASKSTAAKKTAASSRTAASKKTTAAKTASTAKKTASAAKKPASSAAKARSGKAADTGFTLTAAEKKLITLYRSADKATKEKGRILLGIGSGKGESTDAGDVLGNIASAALEMLNRN